MKLYTNGCSFTHGHYIQNKKTCYQYKDFKSYKPYPDTGAWPSYLNDRFETVYNHGLGGSGFKRIVRTTINFIDYLVSIGESLDDWIFVLQASVPNRIEFMTEFETFSTVDFSAHYDGSYEDPNVGVNLNYSYDTDPDIIKTATMSQRLKNSAIDYHVLVMSEEHRIYEQFKEILLITNYFESHGIKYLITGMLEPDYIPEIAHQENTNRWVRMITRQIDSKNFIPVIDHPSRIYNYNDENGDHILCPDYYDPCGHPNKQAHKLAAQMVLTEMEKRNYI